MINTARHTGTQAYVCVSAHMQTGILVSLGCMQGVGPPDKAWLACRNASVSQTGCITFLFVMDEISSLSEPSGTRV